MHTKIFRTHIYFRTLILPVLPLATVIVTMALIEIGQTFSSLATAKAAIKLAISEQHESFIIDYSDKTRFRIMCPMRIQSDCDFQVRAPDSKKHGVTTYLLRREIPLAIVEICPYRKLSTKKSNVNIAIVSNIYCNIEFQYCIA